MNPVRILVTALRGTFSLLNKVIYSITHPIKGLENLVRVIKTRAFSLLLFVGSAVLVYLSTLSYLPSLLVKYGGFEPNAALDKARLLAIFTETILGLAEIKRWKKTRWLFLLLVLLLNVSGFAIELVDNFESSTPISISVQILMAMVLNALPILGMAMLGHDISKIPSKRRNRKKRRTHEELQTLRKQIFELSKQNVSYREIARRLQTKPQFVSRVLNESVGLEGLEESNDEKIISTNGKLL